ncbi:hypothetical protein COLO4_34409 [Corchorus olitorius]|uniref:Uncharacterized protein n=1 Tax=Corchorus olitorius TaxID=93759 RepID=A0A1R3GKT9_9ROSI|nr:hypothetical protein COLO4_34409 [Corchorus olitorius]
MVRRDQALYHLSYRARSHKTKKVAIPSLGNVPYHPKNKEKHAQSVIANSFPSTKTTSLSLQPRLVVHCITVKFSACQGLCERREFQPKMAYQIQAISAPAQSPSPSSNLKLLQAFLQ